MFSALKKIAPERMKQYYNAAGFQLVQYAGLIPSQTLRYAIYRLFGLQLGRGSVIFGGCEIREPGKIIIGSGSSVGHRCILDGRYGLVIGNNVNLSTAAWIWTMEHDPNASDFCARGAPVVVEDFAWIGGRTIIMPGITVHRGAVVASGAVVTRDVSEFTIVAGVPARVIGERNRNLDYKCGPGWPII